MSISDRFRELVTQRNGFILYSLVGMGVPLAVGLLLWVGKFGGPLLWIAMTAISFGTAYAWGMLAWKMFGENGAKRYHELMERRNRHQPSGKHQHNEK